MYENAEYIRDLIVKHIREEITPEEGVQLQQWINRSAKNKQLFDELTALPSLYEKLTAYDRYEAGKEIVWEKIDRQPGGRLAFLKSGWVKYAAAAVVVMIGGYWLLTTHSTKPVKPEVVQQQEKTEDIAPGQYKAMLTLDNGQKIVLDSAVQGQLTKQGNTVVLNKNGQLVYDASKASGGEVTYNTLTTAKGQTYATVLADGSKVWLNAQSSIRYPVAFVGNERQVEVIGEAYFEVAHDVSKPFIVKASSVKIEVLGTHFNVNSYSEENAVKTTLLEGKVKVRSTAINAQTTLVPGEQARFIKQSQALVKVNDIDVDAEVAWRFGLFQFDNADLKTVMRQLERWYDVEVQYSGAIPDREFVGTIPRSINLSKVLTLLEKQNVKFKIDGKKIIVTP